MAATQLKTKWEKKSIQESKKQTQRMFKMHSVREYSFHAEELRMWKYLALDETVHELEAHVSIRQVLADL